MTTPNQYDGYYLELSPDDFVVEGDEVRIIDRRMAEAARIIQERARETGETVKSWIKK